MLRASAIRCRCRFAGRCSFVARVKSFLSAFLVAATSLLLVRCFCRGWVRLSLRLHFSGCGVSVGFVRRYCSVSRGGNTLSFDGLSVVAASSLVAGVLALGFRRFQCVGPADRFDAGKTNKHAARQGAAPDRQTLRSLRSARKLAPLRSLRVWRRVSLSFYWRAQLGRSLW